MEHRNAKYIDDQRIDLGINHPALGWIPFTLSPDDLGETAKALRAAIDLDAVAVYEPPPIAAAIAEALAQIDLMHAQFMRRLTKGATPEERDTWPIQEAAARAFEAGVASIEQTEMMTSLARGADMTVADFAQYVIVKARATYDLVGQAGEIRVKGRRLVKAAADPAEIGAVLSALMEEAASAASTFAANHS